MPKPAPEITVRRATPADAEALGRLGAVLVAVHHQYDPDRFIAPTAATERGYAGFLKGELARDDAVILVAEDRDGVLGYVYAALEGMDWMSLRGPAGAIYDIVVDPDRRGAGVGRRLLDEVLAALAALGAPQVVLSTAYPNEGARRLFAAAGFRPTMIEMTRPGGGG
ncbi:GNAT family N-acetyltransferase [Phenylobacterium sp.]|jgi:ribosomal protein S18 acetylase RimI-like enzyme|uniref:GNAT family N-acetyltransferase n=1 Tax=Phenylobacterium sp. TaxID=1871053 RepID=UPI002F93F99C